MCVHFLNIDPNVGTLWIGNTCFAYKKLIDYVETDAELVGAVALGYKAENPSMRPRKRLEDIVYIMNNDEEVFVEYEPE